MFEEELSENTNRLSNKIVDLIDEEIQKGGLTEGQLLNALSLCVASTILICASDIKRAPVEILADFVRVTARHIDIGLDIPKEAFPCPTKSTTKN